MTAKCTGIPGGTCSGEVPFRINKDSIETATGRIDCDLSKVLGALGTVLPPDAQVTRTLADLHLYSLCDACWARMDNEWGKGVYLPIAARAVADGIFFHTSMPDFKDTSGKLVNVVKVRCTLVHELVHWTVATGTHGFQQTAETGHGLDATKWDECMTDYLALTTYKKLGWGAYETGYNNLSQFIDVGVTLLKATPKFKKDQVLASLKGAFAQFASETDLDKVLARLAQPLFEKLALRYVKDNGMKKDATEPVGFVDFMNAVFPTSRGGKLGGYGPKTF